MNATILPFPTDRQKVVPFAPRGPFGQRRVVDALRERVDIWRDGRVICTDIEVGEAAIHFDAINEVLGEVLRQLHETGKTQVGDMVLRVSDTGGRAA